MIKLFAPLAAVIASLCLALPAVAQETTWYTSSSLGAETKYKDSFPHYDYVNPNAPKGGTLNSAALGTFDSFNPFIVKGTAASGLTFFGGLLWDTLMAQGIDEASVSHPLIAEAFTYPDDYSSATYRLNPNAKFHDGKSITAEDVKWSMETLKQHSPQHVRYFANVQEVEIIDERTVRFVFNEKNNRELPHIMGDLPVLPKHWWTANGADGQPRDFTRSTLEIPLGNGPYRIASFSAGSSVTWERVPDYWAADLPVNKGRYNVDKRVIRYFTDPNAIWQAFTKGGLEDIREENRAQRWAQEYNFPAFEKGLVKRTQFKETSSFPMVGWVFNQRRDIFKDRRVRKALSLVLNFERMNKDLFFDQYKRLNTYFGGTELSATGMPEGRELEILEEFKAELPPEIFTEPFTQPVYESRGDERKYLREAFDLLKEAGWVREGTQLVNEQTKEPFKFVILGFDPNSERVNAPWMTSLRRLGIDVSYRVVDTSQFIQRRRGFDYDVVVAGAVQSLSPGNEQRDYWTSKSADTDGSRNWFGLKNPVVDKLVDRIIFAKDRTELVATTNALDRVLLFEYLQVHQWYLDQDRVAWWDKFGIPEKQPLYVGYDPESWWIDSEKEAALNAAQ
ncbi:extracellular solute-binding protein [Pseudahrensia aquimaris]|uniref:Extracellular solute-binding protein n=1 Tax=Pseudahrensia aquimaris TaxID=744461 RepID=A0ABW3FGL5_9HYPH